MLKTALFAASIAGSVALFHGHPSSAISRLAAVTGSADPSPDFAWTGTVGNGGWLRIRDLAGSIEVRRTSGSTIDVHATREPDTNHWFLFSRPIEPVRFVTQRNGADVVICAISDEKPTCNAGDLSSPDNNGDWHPQPMHIVVLLPTGVSLQTATRHGDLHITDAGANVIARTGHGSISIRNVAGTVDANTGHGDMDIANASQQVSATTGHGNIHLSSVAAARANTGHGDIVAELAANAATGANDMMFETGHGNVSVTAPRALSGDVDMHTGRGRVSSDFPLTMDNLTRHSRNGSAHGVLGAGGRSVTLSSGHGDVRLTTAE